AERFIPNPFSGASPTIYKTGDRARYLEDGRIVFLGREDFQVKIRGYRIELGDVETAVVKHPAVSQCITVARDDSQGNKQLVSYLIAERGQLIPPAAKLRQFLRQQLPEYMLPAHFVTLDKFPLTPNNKINRLALPAPQEKADLFGLPFVAPRNQLETELANLMANTLDQGQVSVEANFFDLGGNSLLAMHLLSQVREAYHVSISAHAFFQQPTVANLRQAVENAAQLSATPEAAAPNASTKSAVHTGEGWDMLTQSNLTRNQFLMWMGQRTAPDKPLYNFIQAFSIHGPVNAAAFQQAFQQLVDRSDILRTVIEEPNAIPQQRVLDKITAVVEQVDFSSHPEPEAAYRSWLDERKVKVLPFNQPLFDSALIKLRPAHYIWYLNQHHLITDVLSSDLIFKRVSAAYKAIVENRPDSGVMPPQFAEHVQYERQIRQTRPFREAVNYWQVRSQTSLPPTDFYGRVAHEPTLETSRVNLELGPARSAKLREIAAETAASSSADFALFTIFASLLSTTLYRLNGQKTVRIGTPFHGRPTANARDIIGLFIEMGLLQVEIDKEDTFAALIDKVLAETLSGLAHIQSGISSAATNQAYDVVLNYLQPTFTEFGSWPVSYEWVHSGFMDRAHALRLQITDFEGAGNFSVAFDMKAAIFGEQEQGWLVEHFLQVVDAFIADSNQPLGGFSLMSAAEQETLFTTFNDTDAPYPQEKTVVHLFEEQVQHTPQAIAAVQQEASLSFSELNQRANQLAHYLQAQGVGAETAVALCMERSMDVLVAILGILKAGGAYIPIDPAYPVDRIAYMLQDAEPALVFTDGETAVSELSSVAHAPVFNFSSLQLSSYSTENPPLVAAPNNLVYVIYTSGSTGKPKGTMLTHRGLINYVWWARQTYTSNKALDFPLYSSLAFDLTVTSIFVPFISGGRIVIYGESDYTQGLEILAVFQDDAVDIVKLTPAHLTLVLEANISVERIKKLIVGGEDFKTDLAKAAQHMLGEAASIYNEYGPTEAVVGCMVHQFDPDADSKISVPIGVPAANARIYLLDVYSQPVPRGVTGEMVISSDGVARGYINRPDLTNERFGTDPFRPDARIYRTGDISRWDASGQLVFLGRRDNQVKIRGARIELGEVEAAIKTHPAVESVLVDVSQRQQTVPERILYCVRCGLPSNYPEADFDSENVCADCRAYGRYQAEVARYFRTPQELSGQLQQIKEANAEKPYDCMVLLSGGKDSTYMLYQLVHTFGMRPLVFSLDNGYISEQALDNVRRMCADLSVGLEIATTPHMNAIFADSLRRHSNVCDGCYKTIYTLSMNLANQYQIGTIITGLARGQLFETRLADTFRARCFEPATIDTWIKDARKAYHQIEDATTQLLDVRIFNNDRIFDEIEFLDFYRYIDVGLDEVYDYLTAETVWQRPSDTGRSTNCLINDAGIYIHNKERGYHNYALPYSWDVRLGHKTRDMAMHELDDELNLQDVRQMLAEVGYDENEKLAQREDKRLVAYTVSNQSLTATELRTFLSQQLPEYMIPSVFIALDTFPLTQNGKIDRQALPDPSQYRPDLETPYAAPTNAQEALLLTIWNDIFQLPEIGIYDNFFDLGGDSIISIQIVARARQEGLQLAPSDIFNNQTVAELATQVVDEAGPLAEQAVVTGKVPLTPIQHWFFKQGFTDTHHWNQSLWLDLPNDVETAVFTTALQHVIHHHDVLRLRFAQEETGWQQEIGAETTAVSVPTIDLSHLSTAEQTLAMAQRAAALESSLNLQSGPLVQAAIFHLGNRLPSRLFITVHHLAIDGVSWGPLLEDLETAYHHLRQGEPVVLPRKSSSYKQWAERLQTVANSSDVAAAASFWTDNLSQNSLFSQSDEQTKNGETAILSVSLDPEATSHLLQDVSTAYNTSINDVLLTAAALAFTENGLQETLSVMLEGHGRDEAFVDQVDLSRTVGWFTSQYPITLTLPTHDDLGAALVAVKEHLRQRPDDGISYGLGRYLRQDLFAPNAPEPDILFNYMGQFERLLPASGFFTLERPLQAGFGPNNQPTHPLIIDSYVWQGVMQAKFSFDPARIAPEQLQEIANQYIAYLEAIIDHCLAVDSTEYTRSDFDLIDLDDEQFDRLADILSSL
ncbi:MAG: amino acid adenylation domain-containing protein, partial [Chloroflexota bacterium]